MINQKLLGWMVIVYAGLTSGTMWSLFWLLRWRLFRWDITLDGVLWAYVLLGGIGLVLHRPWGKWLMIFASGGSLAVVATRLAPLWNMESFGANTRILVWTLICGLFLLFILLAGIVLKTPRVEPSSGGSADRLDPAAASQKSRLDKAYASHLGVVLMASIMYFVQALGEARIIDPSAYQGWITLFGILFAVPLVGAAIIAVQQGIAYQFPGAGAWQDYAAVVYIAAAALLAVRWFFFARRGAV